MRPRGEGPTGEPLSLRPGPAPLGVSPVIGGILLVAVTVAMSGLLYLMTAGILPNPTAGAPALTLLPAAPTGTPGEYRLRVSAVGQRFALAAFQVQAVNLSSGLRVAPTPVDLRPSSSLLQGAGITLAFTDLDNDGALSGGDFFLLQGVRPGQSYLVAILWKASGNLIDSWTVPVP